VSAREVTEHTSVLMLTCSESAEVICDGRPVAAAAIADTPATRRKGLLGTDAVEGALWITKCPSVHMMGMRYPIDVAVVDREGVVLKVATLRPWTGGTRPRLKAAATIEAPAGALATWGVIVGSRLAYDAHVNS
jgi:uncharacterized membrane protein (UPF0127 family)